MNAEFKFAGNSWKEKQQSNKQKKQSNRYRSGWERLDDVILKASNYVQNISAILCDEGQLQCLGCVEMHPAA